MPMRAAWTVVLAVLAISLPGFAWAQTPGEVFRKVTPSVVVIRAKGSEVRACFAEGRAGAVNDDKTRVFHDKFLASDSVGAVRSPSWACLSRPTIAPLLFEADEGR